MPATVESEVHVWYQDLTQETFRKRDIREIALMINGRSVQEIKVYLVIADQRVGFGFADFRDATSKKDTLRCAFDRAERDLEARRTPN